MLRYGLGANTKGFAEATFLHQKEMGIEGVVGGYIDFWWSEGVKETTLDDPRQQNSTGWSHALHVWCQAEILFFEMHDGEHSS